MGEPSFAFDFAPRSFDLDRIEKAFIALIRVLEGSLNELKENKVVIFDMELDRFVIVP